MAKQSTKSVFGGKGLSLSAFFLVACPTPAPAIDWINWNKVLAQPTTTTTMPPEPGFKDVFCKNYPSTPVVCPQLSSSPSSTSTAGAASTADAGTATDSGPECKANDPRCCKASSCYSLPITGLGCWEQRGSTHCVGSGLSFSGGVFFKRGACMCARGLCSDQGHCPDAPDKTALVIPGSHTWGDSLSKMQSQAQSKLQSLQGKFKVGEGSVAEVEVPPENVERTLAILVLATLCAVAASATLGIRYARRLLRPSAALSAEAQPLAPQPDNRPEGESELEGDRP